MALQTYTVALPGNGYGFTAGTEIPKFVVDVALAQMDEEEPGISRADALRKQGMMDKTRQAVQTASDGLPIYHTNRAARREHAKIKAAEAKKRAARRAGR